MENAALVVVDMLYDFIDGTLACEGAEEAVQETIKFIKSKPKDKKEDEDEITGTFPILFVRDHHPANHSSFKEFGGIWPPHCVAGTRGAEIHEDLQPWVYEELSFYKGEDKDLEQYSGFEGTNKVGQSLSEVLELLDAQDVYVCGIATEFCVKNTCLDLLNAGFNVHLLTSCVGWVDKEGHKKAIAEMEKLGVKIY